MTRRVLLHEVPFLFRATECFTPSGAFVADYLRLITVVRILRPRTPFNETRPRLASLELTFLPLSTQRVGLIAVSKGKLPFVIVPVGLDPTTSSCGDRLIGDDHKAYEVHDLPLQAGGCQPSLSPGHPGLSVMPARSSIVSEDAISLR